MIKIEKVEISYFRSFDDNRTVIADIKNLNIFSGANDSGKSNILRALNLFFNGEISPGVPFDINRDLSINRENVVKNQTKPKRFVDITVYFKGSKTKLRDEHFSIKKRWNADSKHSTTVYQDKNWQAEIYNLYREPNITKKFKEEEKYKGQREKSVNRILNSIFFFYVPAVKDERFYAHLYSKLLSKIQKNESSHKSKDLKMVKAISDLEKLINEQTKDLLDGIEDLKTNFSVPAKLEDFFATFDLKTREITSDADKQGISIRLRGDGLRAKSIPILLSLLEKNEKSIQNPIFIWGFEEPENSYEYKNAQRLAQNFRDIYSKSKQIFITTHSFNFLSLEGSHISKYRVWKSREYSSKIIPILENVSQQQILLNFKKSEKEKLEEDLGLYYLTRDLEKVYKEKMEATEFLLTKTKELDSLIAKHDHILLTEGKTDTQILREAWKKLYPTKTCKFIIEPRTGTDTLRIDLLGKSQDKDFNKNVIGIFDNDAEGNNKYKTFKNGFDDTSDETYSIKKSKINNVYAMLLPIPVERKIYVPPKNSKKCFEIEHYFNDEILKEYFGENSFKDCDYRKNAQGQVVEILEIPESSKQKFADKIIENSNNIDFSNFKLLFEKIEELFGLC